MHNCKLITDIAVFTNDKVLLVKYRDGNKYDHQTGWFLPDDELKEFEDPDDSAKRILEEQLGISNADSKISFVESFKGNDSSWHIVFHYKTILTETEKIVPSGDIESSEWFDLKSLPDKKEVAHHGWALYTIDAIQSRLKLS
ncbi:MAG: NUDIX domain-containing protein [Ignavibacteria bacterium]|nr:NUDIX domain-containing protein [Ignavibacteria bacterium]